VLASCLASRLEDSLLGHVEPAEVPTSESQSAAVGGDSGSEVDVARAVVVAHLTPERAGDDEPVPVRAALVTKTYGSAGSPVSPEHVLIAVKPVLVGLLVVCGRPGCLKPGEGGADVAGFEVRA
jgi:hypothetical protein